MTHSSAVDYRLMANALRFLALDAVEKAQSGHPGLPMGMADVATVLFSEFLKFDPKNPKWPDRDRFVLSAGHGSMLLYGLGYLCGYEDLPLEQLKKFRRLGSVTPGHPELGEASITEITTGPLGQGIGNAVGMALAESLMEKEFGREICDHRTFVLVGDGCLMEGLSQEAAALAGHLGLNKLVALFDDNRVSIDGPTALTDSVDQCSRFAAAGWNTINADGHCHRSIREALAEAASARRKPTFIAFRTEIGYGSPEAGTNRAHSDPMGREAIAAARKKLKWRSPPFVIPEDVLAGWRRLGRGDEFKLWQKRLAASKKRRQFESRMKGELPEGWAEPLIELRRKAAGQRPEEATRASSGRALAALTSKVKALVGGSADLSGSNKTKTEDLTPFARGRPGRYIHYGAREHLMAAAMNGMAAHGGVIPYGGSFLIFLDYCRNSVRLAALMRLRVIFIATHDSIGLGEDGPTHQPVEQLAGLRAVPNLLTFRPADAVETAECWELALAHKNGPTALVLTRQAVPTHRSNGGENLSAMGGYEIKPAADCRVSLLASGSEVDTAMKAAALLKLRHKISAKVVSMPSFSLFDRLKEPQKRLILGENLPRVAVEAGSPFGWGQYLYGLGSGGGAFVGMDSFGASAPGPELYQHFGITPEKVAAAALKLLKEGH